MKNKKLPEVAKTPKDVILTSKMVEDLKSREIIVKKPYYELTYEKETGNEIKSRKVNKINITKKINEEKKLIKNDQAEKKLAELERIFKED